MTASRTPYVNPPKTSCTQFVTSVAITAIRDPMFAPDGNSAAHT